MLIISSLLIILSNAVSVLKKTSILYSRITNLILLSSCILIFFGYNFLELSLCGGVLHFNFLIQFFSFFILIVSYIILNLTSFEAIISYSPSIINKFQIINNISKISEYSIILLMIVIGAIFLITSLDLITIFLCIELQSYGLYILCTIHKDSESSTYAGLTYFLLGSLASSIILLGQGILYANTGNTNLENLYIITMLSDESIFINFNIISLIINLSFIIISIGLLFKLSASPFHFWSPDIYDAIPTIITTFVAIIAKISLLILLFILINYSYNSNIQYNWNELLLISSLLSLIVGSILGLTQKRIKRLYAYSTISHLGFILLTLCIYNLESIQAFFFYLIQYSLSNINIFFITILMGYTFFFYKKINSNKYLIDENKLNKLEILNSPLQLISQLQGYMYINPFLSISLAISLFSFAGIPPLSGFFAKLMILNVAIDNGYIITAFIAIFTSVISAVYYLYIIKEMFFNINYIKINKDIDISFSYFIVDIISILSLLILSFIFIINMPISMTYIIAFNMLNSF